MTIEDRQTQETTLIFDLIREVNASFVNGNPKAALELMKQAENALYTVPEDELDTV